MLGSCAYGLFHDIAVFQNHQRGNAHDPIAAGQFRLLVDVYLADFDVFTLFSDLVQNRCYHPAGTAPAGEEVKQYGLVGIHNLLMNILLVDMQSFHCVFLLEIVFFFCDYSIPQK